jgi:hypothetical protein
MVVLVCHCLKKELTPYSNDIMALFRSVSASLAQRPPEDDELANIPNVQASYDTYVKWLAVGAAGAWDGVGISGPSPPTVDGLVDVAETAVHHRKDFITAMKAVQTFFAQDPPRNQVIGVVFWNRFPLSVGLMFSVVFSFTAGLCCVAHLLKPMKHLVLMVWMRFIKHNKLLGLSLRRYKFLPRYSVALAASVQ